jgi:uncharacterized protein (TIRG00374 family)
MGKREVLARFVAGAAIWIVVIAIVGERIGGIPGKLEVAAGTLVLIAVAWGTFYQNAPLFGRVVGVGSTDRRVAALTFDDGPSGEYTPAVLDALRAEGVHATFFVLGRQAREHPDIVRRIAEEGHELASHGDDHSILALAGPTQVATQIRAAEAAITAACPDGMTRLMRTPHGFRSPFVGRVASELGYRLVGWRGSIFDTSRPGVDVIVRRCTNVLRPGAILLLHDADGSGAGDDRSQTVAAVPGIVAAAREKDIELVTVSQLAADLRPQPRTLLKAIVIGVALIAVVAVLSQRFSFGVVANIFTQADFELVLLALVANLGSVAAKSLTWKAALEAMPEAEGEQPFRVSLRDVVPPIFIGFLLNTVLFARLGEVARVSVLRRKLAAQGRDVATSAVVGTVVTEQLLSGATLVLVLAGVVALVPVPAQLTKLLAVLSGVVILVGLFAAGIEVWTRLRRRSVPLPKEEDDDYVERWWHLLGISVTASLDSLNRGQAIFRHPRLAAWGVVTAAASWVAQIAGIYWALDAYGIHDGIGAAGVVFLASTVVGLFPIVPGNLGVFQVGIVTVLVGLYNVSSNTAITFSLALQLIEAILGVGIGFVFLSMEGLSLGELRSEAVGEAEAA